MPCRVSGLIRQLCQPSHHKGMVQNKNMGRFTPLPPPYKSIIFGSLDARASDNTRNWKKVCAKLFHIHAIHDARVSRALEFGNSCVTLCLPCVRNLYTPCSSNQASRDARIWEKVCDKLFHIRTIHDP